MFTQPQDLTSGVNGNPASLTQFAGTQFSFGGAWAEPTFNMNQSAPIPALDVLPYSAKSTAPGVPIGNIGVTQDLHELGMPATFALGFVTTSGVFADFRQMPASNGTNAALTIFSLPVAVGVDLNERLSVGASLALAMPGPRTPSTPRPDRTSAASSRETSGRCVTVKRCSRSRVSIGFPPALGSWISCRESTWT